MLVTTACQVKAGVGAIVKHPARTRPNVIQAVSTSQPSAPTAAASAVAAAPSAAAPKPSPQASGPLVKPSGAFRALNGAVQLDATYVLAQGAGLVSKVKEASIIRLGDSALIANNSGNLISDNGGGLISDNGGGLISDNGAGLISDNGGGILANNGGNIVANNGGNLTSKVKFGLLDVGASTPASLPPGATQYGLALPAAGMAVGVQDLTTGKLVPIGQDAAGHPAYVLVTNATGTFTAFVPQTTSTAVRIVAAPREGTDPRLRTALLTSKLDQTAALDDDTAQVAAIVRDSLSTTFERLLTASNDETETEIGFLGALDPTLKSPVRSGTATVKQAMLDAHVDKLPAAQQRAIANRMADIALARVQLETVMSMATDPLTALGFPESTHTELSDGPKPAVSDLQELLGTIRAQVGQVMSSEAAQGQDPTAYFAAKSYIQDAEARDHVKYEIRKPSDFDDFIVHGTLANPNLDGPTSLTQFVAVFQDPDVKIATFEIQRLMRAYMGISLELMRQTYTGDHPAATEIQTYLKQLPAAKS